MDAGAWDERYGTAELVWSTEPNTFVAAECADLPPGRAVDLAAGEGRNAIWLSDRGWDVTAVDFSRAGLDKGQRLAGDRPITWVHADVLAWEPESRFDLAVLAYLQLPAEQRREAVRRGFGALRTGGTFLLVAHDTTNLTQGVGGPQDERVLMTAEDVLADLDGQAFSVIRAERVAREVTADEAHRGEPAQTAYDCLVRLVRD